MLYPGHDDGNVSYSSVYENIARTAHLQKRRESKKTEKAVLEELNCRIPFLSGRRDVPKVKTLRLTAEYIRHLQRILNDEEITEADGSSRPLTIDDFQPTVEMEMKKVNDYITEARREMREEALAVKEAPLPFKKPRLALANTTNTFVPPTSSQPPANHFFSPVFTPAYENLQVIQDDGSQSIDCDIKPFAPVRHY